MLDGDIMKDPSGGSSPGAPPTSAVVSISALVTGQGVSAAGSAMSSVVFTWIIVRRTGSAASLSEVMTLLLAPSLILYFVGGDLTDRFGAKRLIVFGDVVRGCTMGALALLVLRSSPGIATLLGAAIFLGLGQALADPALRAAVGLVAPKTQLARTNSLIDGVKRGASAGFPALAGVLAVVFHVGWVLAIDGVTFFVSALSIVFVSIPVIDRHKNNRGTRRQGFFGRVGATAKFVGSSPMASIVVALAALINFADALVVIYPLFIEHSVRRGIAWYGIVNSGVMVGIASVAAMYVILGKRAPVRRFIFLGGVVEGFGLLVASLTVSPVGSVIGFFLFGAGMAVFGTAAATLLQASTPADMLGRVMGFYGGVAFALIPVGYGAAAALSGPIGPAGVIGLAGVVMVTSVAVAGVVLLVRDRSELRRNPVNPAI